MRGNIAPCALAECKPHLAQRYGVTTLALFGSRVRDEANHASDVDVLVAFDGPATSERCFGVQFHLENRLGCAVDLVTEKALRPELRQCMEREAATHIPHEIREKYTTGPWRLIVATRNRLIHGHLGIDDDTVGSIVESHTPPMVSHLKVIATSER